MNQNRWACVTAALMSAALSSCSGGSGGSPTSDLLSFAGPPNFAVVENGTATVPVVVRRLGGGVGAASVTVLATGGTATGGAPPLAPPADYDSTPIVVSWLDGDVADKTVAIPILDDGIAEPNETITLTLTTPVGAALGAFVVATLTITNDDFPGAIEFTAAAFSYGENGTAIMPITVRRVGGSAGAVDAVLSTSDGTANSSPSSLVEPVDYAPTTTTVFFADGDAADKIVFLVGIVQDLLPEVDETIVLNLSAPTNGASLGPQSSATLAIVDDDVVLTLSDPTPGLDRRFGSEIVGVAGKIVVGVPLADVPGATDTGLLSVRDPATGVQTSSIPNPLVGCVNCQFGGRIAVQGSKILVTAAPSNQLPLIDVLTTALVNVYGTNYNVGPQMAPAFIPGRIVVGMANTTGAPAPLFSGILQILDQASATQLQVLGYQANDAFGVDVAVAGTRIFAGAPNSPLFSLNNAGVVRVFDGEPSVFELLIVNPFPAANDFFGQSIAVNDGILAVGAPGDSTAAAGAGAVYLFDALSGSLLQTILPPTPIVNGKFGSKIGTVRDRFAIRHETAGTSASGTVVIVDLTGTVVQTIVNPTPQVSSGFGAALNAFDGALLVGAPLHNVGASVDAGIAYVFKVN